MNSKLTKIHPEFMVTGIHTVLPCILFQIQLSRRVIESLLITKHSDSMMHCLHLMFGLVYYPGLSVSITVGTGGITQTLAVVSVIVFTWGSWHQFRCHKILADLRSSETMYGIPRGDWFEYVSSPHYTAEMVLYVGILLSSNFNGR